MEMNGEQVPGDKAMYRTSFIYHVQIKFYIKVIYYTGSTFDLYGFSGNNIIIILYVCIQKGECHY